MRKSLRLETAIDPPMLAWCADERKFRQVVLNLVTNAVKFTPPGGRVRVEARVREAALEIAVSDTGVGIAPENQALIFDPFRQLAAHGSPRQEGTGLGLALSRQLVELHGGTLTVNSVLGEGAVFTARLPAAQCHGDD